MYNTSHYVKSMPKSVSIQKLASYLQYMDKNQIYVLLYGNFDYHEIFWRLL